MVDGKPFLVLGGELFNNSATSLDYMKPVWPRLTAMHLNTVLAPVSWALLEPTEGKFDYTLVDGLIRGRAGAQSAPGLSLVRQLEEYVVELCARLGEARSYAIYARAVAERIRDREAVAILRSGPERGRARICGADAARQGGDSEAHTVIMVQVENEVGVIPDARDHSAVANAAYGHAVPAELMDYLGRHRDALDADLRAKWQSASFKTSGSWETIFGAG